MLICQYTQPETRREFSLFCNYVWLHNMSSLHYATITMLGFTHLAYIVYSTWRYMRYLRYMSYMSYLCYLRDLRYLNYVPYRRSLR